MPYHYSRARKQFIADLHFINNAIKEAHSGKCSSPVVRDFALCSAVVLTSAKLEGYLESLVSDWGKAVLANALTTEKLPRETRAFLLNEPSIESAYRRLGHDGNEAEFLSQLAKLVGTSMFQFAKDGESVPPFHVGRVYSGVKYPSPKNFRKLFRRLGIEPVFPKLASIGKRDVEALLTSFNDVRTEMAHQGMPVGMSATDVKKRISGIESTVGYVDRLFYSHVVKTTGPTSWTA